MGGGILIAVLLACIVLLLMLPENAEVQTDEGVAEVPETGSGGILSAFTPKAKIPAGVTVNGIPMQGMTEEKALSVLNEQTDDSIYNQDMIVVLGENELRLTPEISEARWETEEAASKAMDGISTERITLSVNKNRIRSALENFLKENGGVYSPSGFWLEGTRPDLKTRTGTLQTLVLSKGSAGKVLNTEDLLDKILQAYQDGEFRVVLQDTEETKEPAPLDLAEIKAAVSTAPIDPVLDKTTFQVTPGCAGCSFDTDEAEAALAAAQEGETVRISMQYTEPISEEDAWIQDTLGACKTEYTDNENRNNNLRLACEKLNGLILQPGETLSYNDTLGKRTREAGYLPAPSYVGTELVDELGGGICQVSSTLYLSSLFAELTIVERKNHGYPVNYIPLGLDATVNWGTTDLKIRNDYDYAVKILAEVTDTCVWIRIMGVELRDYTVKMEYRVDDHPSYAAAYRCRYDSETGEEIYRALDHTSIYLEDVWCWPGYAESASE